MSLDLYGRGTLVLILPTLCVLRAWAPLTPQFLRGPCLVFMSRTAWRTIDRTRPSIIKDGAGFAVLAFNALLRR